MPRREVITGSSRNTKIACSRTQELVQTFLDTHETPQWCCLRAAKARHSEHLGMKLVASRIWRRLEDDTCLIFGERSYRKICAGVGQYAACSRTSAHNRAYSVTINNLLASCKCRAWKPEENELTTKMSSCCPFSFALQIMAFQIRQPARKRMNMTGMRDILVTSVKFAILQTSICTVQTRGLHGSGSLS